MPAMTTDPTQAIPGLQSHVIVPLTASPGFQSTLLMITFDQGNQADLDHGVDNSPPSASAPKPKKDSSPPTPTRIRATLRLILAGSGVNGFPGLTAIAPEMTEFSTGP